MPRDGDQHLLEALQQGLESGQVALHVSYRKARRVGGFKQSLIQQVGARSVMIRDWFMAGSLSILAIWFFISQALGLEETSYHILGSPVSVSFFTFALVLLALVLFSRQYIKPMQGRPMHRAAMRDADLFAALWQGGALALMAREGSDRLCQSPRDDWRVFAQRAMTT